MIMNAAADLSQARGSSQSLAMDASGGAAAPATAAAVPAANANADQAAAAAAVPGAAGDAGVAAAAVQPPPSTSKIVLQSVMKTAMTGASIGLGFKSFGPFLAKIPFVAKIAGSIGGAGILGFLGKLPLVGKLITAIAPKMAGPLGFLIAGLAGAAVGAVVGLIKGLGAAKKAQADYAAAQAQAAQQAPAPAATPPAADPGTAQTPAPAPAKAAAVAHKPRFKSWVVARHGSHLGTQKFGSYTTKGESMATLCARFHTTAAEIKKLNPSITGDTVPSGTKLKLARKVVPNAKAWTA